MPWLASQADMLACDWYIVATDEEIKEQGGSMTLIKGVDVSENNENIPWDDLQAQGVRFCYVRSSYGKHGRDEIFRENVRQAHAHGMLVGISLRL